MIGINIGVKNIKAAVIKGGKLKLISRRVFDDDLVKTREDAEIYLDDFCTACVVSLKLNNLNKFNKNNILKLARNAGINNIKIISELDAACEYLRNNFKDLNKFLIIDAGAGAAKLNLLERDKLIENVIIDSVSGNKFDELIAEFLGDLRADIKDEKFLLSEAEKLKNYLDLKLDNLEWTPFNDDYKINIYREDLERLIKFQVRELAHAARRLILIYKPEKIFLTGGMTNLPILKSELQKISGDIKLINEDIILHGTALCALKNELEPERENFNNLNLKALRDIKLKLVEIEHLLNRSQKDRLNNIFNKAESFNSLELIKSFADELIEACENY
ncbi:MAG: Hsp70 family protein [Synergistaceae bacterium]|nr:Hsp70 family protein [Synergistaceae bacterium]